NGTLRWTGLGSAGVYINGPLSTAVDLDLDGKLEVVAGRSVYKVDGSILWNLTALPDGVSAVGNFDTDPNPEIVLAASGRIWVLEHTGTIKWTQATSVLGGSGGPVVVADFDGDGQPEIGRSGTTKYGVWETDGTLKWTQNI